ncbi:MAG: aminotransferase class I/II-fold pyridoxal phosphate-dependent enzyme [Bacteroidota bacterium]
METTRREWLRLSLLGVPLLSNAGGCSRSAEASELPGLVDEEVRRLLYNENPYGSSPQARAAITESMDRINRYATFSARDFEDLKQLIADQEGVQPGNVLLGHGSFEVLTWVSAYFGAKGGELVVPTPSFDVVGNFGRSIGAMVKPVAINDDFKMDLASMEAQVGSQTKLVTLCNPNNPTGTSCDQDELIGFCDRVSERAFVLVDEAYIHYLEDWEHRTMARRIADDKNLLVTRTFSKIYGMAGLRVGFLLGPSPLIKSLETRYTLGFPGNMPNTLSVAAAMASLTDGAFLAESRSRNAARRSAFCQELTSMGLSYIESDTNFVYFDVEDFPKYKAKMWESRILLAGGWPAKPNWARVTISTSPDMDFLVEKMKDKSWL